MRFLAALLCLLITALPVRAQVGDVEPLVVPFAQLPPFSFLNEDGERTGFLVDLALLIGGEIGVPIAFLDVVNSREFVTAQASGQTQLIPGVLQLPPLQPTNVFSQQIAVDRLRPAVLSDNHELIEAGVLSGQRVAVVPPAVGSQEPILGQNTVVELATPQAALMELLTGAVDAVLLPPPVVYQLAKNAGIDGRIRFIGAPLKEATRHVALHESRADLMPEINAAIARMETDGRLETVRQRYNITVPPPPPDVLRVPIARSPPYGMVTDQGEITGYAADLFEALAARAGLAFEFEQVSLDTYFAAAATADADVIPFILASMELEQRLDFTSVIDRAPLDILVRQDDTRFENWADLADARVGSLPDTPGIARAKGFAAAQITAFDTVEEIIEALENGQIDAIMDVTYGLEGEGITARFKSIGGPPFDVENVIGLRPGLGAVRERLNAVIPGYLLSDEYRALKQKYFAEPVFWTRARIIWSLIALGAVVFWALAALVLANVRTRVRAANAVLSARRELEIIFNAATSGIVALDAGGQIVRINDRARHFLGGISESPPFAWPTKIRFLEAETLKPLDNSADPVRRALAGHQLNNQTHLMRRTQDGEDQRYVRVDNAELNDPESGIHTVLVIDDVSNEERNRQVVERKGRLDALGQLTGGISHDFNNLLASQLYSVSLARKAKDPKKRDSYLEIAEGSINRERSLTSRLLAFARKQPGLSSVRKTSEVLDDFEKLVRPMLEAQIELVVEVEDEQLRHFCDQTQLETALMNLVLNSRDAILRDGKGNRIEIKARPVRAPNTDLDARQTGQDIEPEPGSSFRYVEITVTDNGPGMDRETLARCTDPFFTTKSSNSGTGLGLAMVFGFVRQSDADLRIYSELDVGTTVRLTLPRGTQDGLREVPMPEADTEQGAGQTVLVVEDEPQLLNMLVDTLEDLGYTVVSVNSGPKAMELVETGSRFDVLLTDVVMPGAYGGFELARRVRTVRPNMPVIYTSGYTGFTASEMGEVQAPLLQKPVPPAELAEAISQALADD